MLCVIFSLNINIHIEVLQSLVTMIIPGVYFKHIKKHVKRVLQLCLWSCLHILSSKTKGTSAVPRWLGAVKCSFFLSRELISAMSLPYAQCKSRAARNFTPKNCPPLCSFSTQNNPKFCRAHQCGAKQEWAGHS